jgi:hypothetical protein
VSGFGGGGFMAVQQHVAFSSLVSGAAIINAGPYYCTMGSSVRAQTACSINPWLLDPSISVSQATQASQSGMIDPVSNLANDKIFLFSGMLDQKVLPNVVLKLQSFYSNFVSNGKISTVYNIEANHAWVTQSVGNPCNYYGPPYINACGFDLSGASLYNLYGNLNAKSAYNSSNFISFEQSDYADVWQAGMSNRGWVYAPTQCQDNPILCRVHVNFHGCFQSYDKLGSLYIKEIGLAEWAESNNIIVVFPQTAISSQYNPDGCWDTWGYTGADFYIKSGLQLTAVNSIIQNITNIIQALT